MKKKTPANVIII